MPPHFPIQTLVPVRFSDTDAMGHVNNARYLHYMEEGRVAYCKALFSDRDQINPYELFPFILADVQCSFKAPLHFGQSVLVGLGITALRRSSFDIEYELHEEKSGGLVATAKSVLVCYDYGSQKSVPISDDFRGRVIKLEKKSF